MCINEDWWEGKFVVFVFWLLPYWSNSIIFSISSVKWEFDITTEHLLGSDLYFKLMYLRSHVLKKRKKKKRIDISVGLSLLVLHFLFLLTLFSSDPRVEKVGNLENKERKSAEGVFSFSGKKRLLLGWGICDFVCSDLPVSHHTTQLLCFMSNSSPELLSRRSLFALKESWEFCVSFLTELMKLH